MFDLVCDPMGPVVDTSLRELVPALLAWRKRENQSPFQLYKGLLSRLLLAAQVIASIYYAVVNWSYVTPYFENYRI